ncbi:unnamed protein product [Ceratitis capitata]|uniref:(Mediterranean fruit fly) hypothetical protein n=1 Tax=Ceratitis capitata TaxID=7213 RepID=A0A811V2L1_CERCA|nr:unnamed protein product [Ceratitis capitata]
MHIAESALADCRQKAQRKTTGVAQTNFFTICATLTSPASCTADRQEDCITAGRFTFYGKSLFLLLALFANQLQNQLRARNFSKKKHTKKNMKLSDSNMCE